MRIENVRRPERAPQTISAGKTATNPPSSSLSSLKQITATEKAQKHFWQAWDFVKYTLLWVYDTILWVFQGCPAEESPLDIMEDIVETPKEMAVECAKRPAEFAAELIVAILLDPNGIKDLRDNNKGAFGDFLREYQSKASNWKKLFPRQKITQVTKKLLDHLTNDPSVLSKALEFLQNQIQKILGTEDKKDDDENVKALRHICRGYLTRVLCNPSFEPENLVALYKALREKGDPAGFVAIIQKMAKPKPNSKEANDLVKIFDNNALVFRQLADPKKYFGKQYKDASPIEFPMAIWQASLAAMRSEDFDTMIKTLGDSNPLLTAVVQRIKSHVSFKKQGKIAANLPMAFEVLQQLDKDLANPPKGGSA